MTDTTPEIKLYNTRTRSKEVFTPIDAENVRMYVCGPTVYDRAHIGNARPVVVFDVLYRLLRHVYGEDAVTYVRNFTDVDDRIIEKAVATKGADETLESATRRITDETIGWYHDDMDALAALRPTHEPRCTDDRMLDAMKAMISALIEKGFAYSVESMIGHNERSLYVMMDTDKIPDHALFEVGKDPNYGQLSGRSVDDMIAGERVEVAPYKRNPMDFVLWKPSTLEQPGWESPWGRGRPGWHIECSAMAKELLGEVFDIHAGGIDLQFPHHENELAQSCCVHGTDRMANWWMHNEMLRVEGEKMSKSLGNFFTVRDLLDRCIPGAVIRVMLLSTHYRKPLDWTEKKLKESTSLVEKLAEALFPAMLTFGDRVPMSADVPKGLPIVLADDLNTHHALTLLSNAADTFLSVDRGETVENVPGSAARQLVGGLKLLGLLSPILAMGDRAKRNRALLDGAHLSFTIAYELAKQTKDFSIVDHMKRQFHIAGVEVRIAPEGTTLLPNAEFDPEKLQDLP